MRNIKKILLGFVLLAVAYFPLDAFGTVEFDFPLGERLVYKIYWGAIPVGEAHVGTEWAELDGRRLLHIRFRVKTNKILSKIYPVNDINESYVDPETFLPVRFIKNISEGKYRCHETTVFNHVKGKAAMTREGRDKKHIFKIKPDTRDIVTFMYYTRSMEFVPGTTNHYEVTSDEKLYDLDVDVVKKEKVKLVDNSKMRSLKLEPRAKFEGLFVRKGRMWMWVSDDKSRIMTKMKAKVPVASIKLLLDEIRNPGERMPIRLPSPNKPADGEKTK